MTMETAPRRHDHGAAGHRAASRAAPERRVAALVAAYIHELSPRHRAEREATEAGPDTGELRT
jgi:hypothetical protein